jgi:hypothetical protein
VGISRGGVPVHHFPPCVHTHSTRCLTGGIPGGNARSLARSLTSPALCCLVCPLQAARPVFSHLSSITHTHARPSLSDVSHPFNAIYLPLNYSGNPGVNVSHRGGGACTHISHLMGLLPGRSVLPLSPVRTAPLPVRHVYPGCHCGPGVDSQC